MRQKEMVVAVGMREVRPRRKLKLQRKPDPKRINNETLKRRLNNLRKLGTCGHRT